MKTTIICGGLSRERLVSVASAQSVSAALPEAEVWFWDEDDYVYETSREALAAHQNPFTTPFKADGAKMGTVEAALDRAKTEGRLIFIAMHGGDAENGIFQVKCEARRLFYTGSCSISAHLSFDKVASKQWVSLAGLAVPPTIALEAMEEALEKYGALFAKPSHDGSSFGLIKVTEKAHLQQVREAARHTSYLVEASIEGIEATCGVLEIDGKTIALPPVEIIPAEGAFDYEAKYLNSSTQEICPARFAPEVLDDIKQKALTAHRILGCSGYSRTDFIVSKDGPIYIETNSLPGLTASSLLPKSLKAEGISFELFLDEVIQGALDRYGL